MCCAFSFVIARNRSRVVWCAYLWGRAVARFPLRRAFVSPRSPGLSIVWHIGTQKVVFVQGVKAKAQNAHKQRLFTIARFPHFLHSRASSLVMSTKVIDTRLVSATIQRAWLRRSVQSCASSASTNTGQSSCGAAWISERWRGLSKTLCMCIRFFATRAARTHSCTVGSPLLICLAYSDTPPFLPCGVVGDVGEVAKI